MTESRSEIKSDIPLIKGSTAHIIKELYKHYMQAENIPDKLLNRCASLDAKTAQLRQLVDTTGLLKTREDITINLSFLDQAIKAAKEAKTKDQELLLSNDRNHYADQYKSKEESISTIQNGSQSLETEYKKIVEEQHESIIKLFTAKSAPKETAEAIERLLTKLEARLDQYIGSASIHRKKSEDLQDFLAKLSHSTYKAIPPSIRDAAKKQEEEVKKAGLGLK